MWGAIKRISNDLQELAQRDASTKGEEEDIDPVPATTKLDEEGLVPNATISWMWHWGLSSQFDIRCTIQWMINLESVEM